MRKLVFFILIIFVSACNGNHSNKKQNKNDNFSNTGITKFEFNKELHNFGTLNAGEIVIFSFIFENTGENNLIINNFESDCGCIIVSELNKQVFPGEKGIIEVEFNTSGLFGKQYKTIALKVNTKEKIKYLSIAADVNNDKLEIEY